MKEVPGGTSLFYTLHGEKRMRERRAIFSSEALEIRQKCVSLRSLK